MDFKFGDSLPRRCSYTLCPKIGGSVNNDGGRRRRRSGREGAREAHCLWLISDSVRGRKQREGARFYRCVTAFSPPSLSFPKGNKLHGGAVYIKKKRELAFV